MPKCVITSTSNGDLLTTRRTASRPRGGAQGWGTYLALRLSARQGCTRACHKEITTWATTCGGAANTKITGQSRTSHDLQLRTDHPGADRAPRLTG
jgi:hypothetical protein